VKSKTVTVDLAGGKKESRKEWGATLFEGGG